MFLLLPRVCLVSLLVLLVPPGSCCRVIDRTGANVNFVTKGNLPDSLSVEIGAELEFAPGIPLAGRGAPK